MSLSESRVLLVGGTSGLGLATAKALESHGAVPIVASRNPESVRRALEGLTYAEGFTVDPTDEESLADLVGRVGDIDHLVYTAGEPLALVPLTDLTSERIATFLQTRLLGAVATVRAFAPHVRPGGSITLVTGTAAERPGAGWALGAIVCGAVVSLTRQLAIELAPIRVNAVMPGVTRSPLWSGFGEAEQHAMFESMSGLPLGRAGEVDDVARAFVYAMEQEYATGTILTVDGGSLLV
ncbi:SDR family oxidoreductase [Frondihabitans cladoniiphilus]|uniref:SDR family oxidoreductase n=1 Tax=Frondihabitans cladoniiphilus TaxID=715785 RepID=A0ABP8VYK3_9MICO